MKQYKNKFPVKAELFTLNRTQSFDYILCKLEDDVQIVQVIHVYGDNEYEVIISWVFGVIGVDHRRQLYWIKIKH